MVKGQVGAGSHAQMIVDPARQEDDGFFDAYTFRLIGSDGALIEQVSIRRHDGAYGALVLERALAAPVQVGQAYELSSGEEAPVLGIRKLMGLKLDDSVGPVRVRLGTTRGTNALLERKGADVAFVTTRGFGDLLEIGTQARPELFNLAIRKPKALYGEVVEIDERLDSTGRALIALDESSVEAALKPLMANGVRSLAICFLNAYENPVHEQAAARVAERMGFDCVAVSTDLSQTIKVLDRGDTAVVEAYLAPVIENYVASVRASMPEANLKLMTSAGGLVDAGAVTAKDTILSGPAGGVVGFAHASKVAGFEKAIGFDMGGTSTDVSRFDGEYEYQFTTEKAGVRIVAPMYAIETVAAGGGSVCAFDGQKLTVGPDSAGADPGPACYGRGGPLTVTDVNLFNGKIDRRRFPFGLDRDAVVDRLDQIAARVGMSSVQVADGFTRIANEKMAGAIKSISAARGYDPAEHVLVTFGGAGAQHACAIAELLGIERVLIHPLAGILSAYGIGMADVRRFAGKTVLKSIDALDELDDEFDAMESRLHGEVRGEGVPVDRIETVRMLDMRYRGEDAVITVRSIDDPVGDFERMHEQLYGHRHVGREIEIANVRVEVIGRTEKPHEQVERVDVRTVEADEQTDAVFGGERMRAGLFDRTELRPGDRIEGPAIVSDAFSTIVVDPGWRCEMTGRGDLLLSGGAKEERAHQDGRGTERDPVRLELFSNHFTHIATQMGVTLQRTALSVNVKERLDFSCAILDADGNLIVNAPHIPVHLGAMGECVKALVDSIGTFERGDVYVSNDPHLGGSHLPDVTVMTPVLSDDGQLLFFTASRAHHAEIGGVRPGSAYPFARNLAEEGVVLRNLCIAKGGVFLEEDLRRALLDGAYPSRCPNENVADVRAAVAANHVGARELLKMIERHSWDVVNAYMEHMRDSAEEKTRAAIGRLPDGEHVFEDSLDDGSAVCVRITIRGEEMTVDFTGSAPVNDNSLNANMAVVQSAVLYCLRCLIHEDVPLNAGVMQPIELIVPEGMLNPRFVDDPRKCPAVVAGNVELSQRIVDVIFGALGIAAASQGTMNNLIFGNDRFGYYETICGGAGATSDSDGASCVHTHMTNTRITDVEIIERRYPVRVRHFARRWRSGGSGAKCGGDGVVREIEMLEALEVSLLTQRRSVAPFGMNGGQPGNSGRNTITKGGDEAELGSLAQFTADAGDILTIRTPGGGGFGPVCS